MSESHQREAAIFDAVMELSPEQRAAHLERSCAGDAALRQRVQALLKACESSCEFLDSPGTPEAGGPTRVLQSSFEKAGDRIGRYKLLQQIGEGGCGVVYMAEQEEPISRRVALKIIKLGLDTKSVIARFEAERQALALMDHPNIAKVLDAGATETGRPYFVMELVRGMKITEYCDEAKLSTKARLDLFIQVCQAIQHAHQKGIIHRDIKPSNILVTVNDGVAVPKVIDFGIAKATSGQKLTDKTVFTAFEQFIGTPAYMSPEQAVLTSVDIDTRSDIYALGVLLYELLTGRTPFDAAELLAIGLDEMRRTIREQEPPRPSTRLSTLSGQELSTTAQRRGLEAPKLVSDLDGDLDWIVMKALEKDRARRYETANGLAADIRRHLNNEPVVASPPSTFYRLRKTVQRNKLAFAAGMAVAASLVIGLSLATVSFLRERAAHARADEQAAIAQSVNEFLLEDLLRQADSRFQAEAQFTPDPNLTVREAVDRAAERIDRFKDQPLVEAAVRVAIGNTLIGVGEERRARAHLERALELRRAKLAPNDPDTLSSMHSLAHAYELTGKVDQALPLIQETLKLRKARLGPDHLDTFRSMNLLANVYEELGRFDHTLPLREEMFKVTRARVGPDDPLTLLAMGSLASSYINAGRPDRALPLYEEAVKLAKATLRKGHPQTSRLMANLANAYAQAGKFDQALVLCEEALKLVESSRGPNHPDTFYVMRFLGSVHGEAGNFERAFTLLQDTVKRAEAKLGPDHLETLQAMRQLGVVYSQAGKFHQALPLLDQAVKQMKTKMADHPETVNAIQMLTDAYVRAGKYDQTVPLMEEVVKLQKARFGLENSKTWKAMWNLALCYLSAGKPEQAVTVREEMFKIAEAKHGPGHRDTLGSMGDLGIAYRADRQFDRALPLLEKTVKLHAEKVGPEDTKTLRWMNELGIAYWRAGKLDQARALFQDALPVNQKKLGPDNPSTLQALHNLAWVSFELGQRDQALLLLEGKLKVIEAKRGPEDRDTLNEMSALAHAYAQAAKFDQALALQGKAVTLMRTKFGPEHRETLLTMGNLAVFYDQAGKPEKALPLLDQTVKLMKASLGTNHSETLHAMQNLAAVCQETRRFDQALALYEETFKLQEAKLGPYHPDTLNSMGALVEFFISAKNYAEAEDLGRKLSTAMMQRKGPLPTAARALVSLAQSLLERQQWARAEEVAREHLAMCEKAQPEGWETCNARSLLGEALLGQRKLRDAQPLVVAGYDELKKQSQTRASLDNNAKDDLNRAMDRLEALYDVWQDHPESIRWKAEIERIRRINDPGAIRDWLILAPLSLAPDRSPASGLEQEQLESEANLRPGPEAKASVGSHDFVWRERHLKDYVINFNRLLGEETPWSVAYAVCYVQASAPRKGLFLKVGSDDQARVYLNGQKIYENSRPRALALDEDTIANVELQAGLNVVVFKVVNGGGGWGGSLRFADKDDQPVQGIKITLKPD